MCWICDECPHFYTKSGCLCDPCLDEAPEHADYPHRPGTLYDCPACENECFCERKSGSLEYSKCVFCVSLEEGCPGEPGYDHDPCMECVYDPEREKL